MKIKLVHSVTTIKETHPSRIGKSQTFHSLTYGPVSAYAGTLNAAARIMNAHVFAVQLK